MWKRQDPRSSRGCRDLLETEPGPLVVPMLAVGEAAYLISRRLGPEHEVQFLGDLSTGVFLIEPVRPGDWTRIAELIARYRDFPLGTVDASLIALAERLPTKRIATLDHRHFSVVRPAHVEAFELLP